AIPVHATIHSISSQRRMNHNMLVLFKNFRIRLLNLSGDDICRAYDGLTPSGERSPEKGELPARMPAFGIIGISGRDGFEGVLDL
ncbi:hypothetical protein, partial [Komagataeibacter oboediens]|uniref:hypothetical protein n=1 Tax=Komagataeibacter oboediens TaxID=65958 RepID=UPI001C64E492